MSMRRGFRVIVALDKTDPERMRPGMSVRVEVQAGRRDNVLLAPRAALDFTQDPPKVMLAEGGEKEVHLGPCNALECVVEDGVEERVALLVRR